MVVELCYVEVVVLIRVALCCGLEVHASCNATTPDITPRLLF